MTITYPLSFPALPAPNEVDLGGVDVIGMNTSPFTLQQETYDWSADAWTPTIVWNQIVNRQKAAPLLAVILALRGRLGTVLIGDPMAKTPQGVATGTPVVNGAVAAGSRTLTIRGATASISGWLKAGDYLQLGIGTTQRLYQALTDADSDGSGDVSVDIWPQIREGYSDGTAIVLANCQGTFRLASNQRMWQVTRGIVYATTLNFVEAL